MIKCPYCGSTAQVKVVNTKTIIGTDIDVIHRECECGCGTTFTHTKCYNEFLGTERTKYSNIKKRGE